MTLDAYLKRDGAPSLTELADMIGISKGRLSQLRGKPEIAPDMALKIERATGGELDAALLSPVVAAARKGIAA